MTINSSSILVIDSGVGGIGLLKQLHATFKGENFIYFADNEFMPYGNKSDKTIKLRLEKILEKMIATYHTKAVVLACNTATTVALKYLQSKFNIPIYGVCPTQNTPNNAVVLCTKLTAKRLVKQQCNNLAEHNCYKFLALPHLAIFVENNCFDKAKMKRKAKQIIEKYNLSNFKTIVLGCTHYEYFYDYFCELLPNCKIVLPTKTTIKSMKKDNYLTDGKSQGMVYFLSSMPSKSYLDKMYYIFSH